MGTDSKEERELPEGWENCVVSELADLVRGVTYKKLDAGKSEGLGRTPILRANNIKDSINFDDLVFLPDNIIRSEQKLCEGDILFAMSSGSKHLVGKSARIVQDVDCGFGAFCGVLRSTRLIKNKFLHWQFQTRNFRRCISEVSKGSNINNLKREHLLDYEVCLPPLAEQKRIVSKIEELFSELDAGVESFKQARKQLGIYRQSLLQQAFCGKLTACWRAANPDLLEDPEELNNLIQERMPNAEFTSKLKADVKSWRQFTLDQLTEYITSGSRGWAKYYSDSGDLFIRAQNLNQDFLNLDNVAYVNLPTKAEGRRTLAKFGDILITITGANTTKTGWVNKELGAAYVSQHVALCRPVTPQIAPFIYLFLITPTHGRKTLEKAAYGAGKPGLNLTNIRSLEIPLPSLPGQKEIVRILESQFAVIEQNEREIDAALKRADALRQSILKKAFSGQLVPQDPTDEPASVLFERIREERRVESELGKVKKKAGKINSRATKKRANHNI